MALGSTAGATDLLGWTDVGNVTNRALSSGFTFVDGNTYYATVRAYKTNGLRSSAVNGDGFIVIGSSPTFACNFMTGSLIDCYGGGLSSVARPLIRFHRPGGASSSPGTYFDSSGMLKAAPANYILQSQDFNSTWSSGGLVTPLTQTYAAPDESLTAAKLVETADGAATAHSVSQSVTAVVAQTWTASIYAKAVERSQIQIVLANDGVTANAIRAVFDLSGGAGSAITSVSGNGSALSSSIQSVGNGWYRCVLSGQPDTAGTALRLQVLIGAGGNVNYVGDGASGVLVWGAQLEAGASVSSYVYTTTTANYGPRLDHDPSSCSGGTCTRRGLLVEDTRTNILTSSIWPTPGPTAGNITMVASSMLAPDGTTVVKMVEDATTGAHFIGRTATIVANTAYSYSLFLRAGERNQIIVYGGKSGNPYTRAGIRVNLSDGSLSTIILDLRLR
ncbi:MAG: hypothetical protein HC902_12250 [Calothrix sp. SM1_5_4]|nr:hypothetical protein [Calothrix sp. SM1_5_4]